MIAKITAPLIPELRFPEFKRDRGWELLNGNKLFDQINDRDHEGDLPVLAITQEHGAIPRDLIDYNVAVSESSVKNYKIVRVGDFIISLRSFQGGIEFSEYEGLCSPAYVILREKRDTCTAFFKHLLKSKAFIRELTKNLEGLRDGKMISYKQFSDVLINLPSKEEQQKIADCLGSLDRLIAAHRRKLDALQDHKKSLLQQLFPAEGETTPKLRFPGFEKEGEWQQYSIEEIFDTSTGGTPSRRNPEYWNGNIPWVSTSQIDFCKIDSSDEKITNKGIENSSAKLFPIGTVLIAMYGQGKTRGKVGILGIEASTNQACAAILPCDKAIPEFIFQNLSSRYSELRSLSNDGGQKNLSQGLIRKLPISLPTEIEEQTAIADCLSALDDLVTAQNEEIEALLNRKKGLMQQLFPCAN